MSDFIEYCEKQVKIMSQIAEYAKAQGNKDRERKYNLEAGNYRQRIMELKNG